MPRRKKQDIKINNDTSLEGLMQETYNDACKQINSAQGVITKLDNSTEAEDVEDAAKIAKATTDALKIKDSAIKLKLEVGKLQNEIIKHQGDQAAALKDVTGGKVDLNQLSDLRKWMIDESKKSE